MARLGLKAVELVSFPGCRGNAWGDFGSATDLAPEAIRDALAAAGLSCPSALATAQELEPERLDNTLRWIKGTGAPCVVLTAIPNPKHQDIAGWQQSFAALNSMGQQIAAHGLTFAYHTQPNLWQPCDNVLPAEELLQLVDPDHCRIEFDPTGAIIYGYDPAAYLRLRPECFYSAAFAPRRSPPASGVVFAILASRNWRSRLVNAAGRGGAIDN